MKLKYRTKVLICNFFEFSSMIALIQLFDEGNILFPLLIIILAFSSYAEGVVKGEVRGGTY